MDNRFDNENFEDLFSDSKDLYSNSQNTQDEEDVKTYSPSRYSKEKNVTSSSANGKTFAKRKVTPSSDKEYIDNKMQLPDKKKSKGKKAAGSIGRIILTVFLIFVITGCVVAGAFVTYVFTCVDDSIEFDLNDLKLNNSSNIYVKDPDYDGVPDVTTGDGWMLYQSLSNEKREWTKIEDISINVVNAYVAAEDQNFYEHKGVNWKRTIGAFVNLFVKIYDSEQGGSTITQQLVKNLTGDDSHDNMRKLREIMRARKLEELYSKDTILECYLNVIYLGNGCYGIEAASQYYFDKPSSELTVTEAAAIAAITKAPTYYDPFEYPEDNKDRRNWILRQEYELGKISQEEYQKGCEEELEFIGSKSESNKNKSIYSYFTDAVYEQVVDDLMEEYGYAESYAENILKSGGLNIYSTCDTRIQSIMEEEFLDDDNFALVYGTKQKAQSAMTIMDYSGNIVGIVGGRGEKETSLGLNRATMSPRQPGSTMKPLGVYALGIDTNVITYSTKISNSALTIGGTTFRNYGYNTTGPVTVQHAVEVSYNLPPIRILHNKIGYHNSFVFCTEKLGLKHLVEDSDENANLAVGGLTYGLTSVESTAAYAIFGNGGKYYEPTTYTQVLDSKGEIVLAYDTEPIQAISEESATIMNRILRTVVYGSSATASYADFGDFTVFAKTGTTTDNKDRWFAGGTPYYVSSVWFGCDEPFAMNSLSTGTNPALLVWRAVMQRVHEGLDSDKDYVMSDDVKTGTYCAISGKLKGADCPAGGTGYYKSDYSPVCNGKSDHIIDDVDEEDSSLESSSEDSTGTSSTTSKTQSKTSSQSSSSSKPSSQSKPTPSSSNATVSKPTSSAEQSSNIAVSSQPASSQEPEPVISETPSSSAPESVAPPEESSEPEPPVSEDTSQTGGGPVLG